MGWKVVFSPRSESDLQKIVSYIAKDDSAAAIRFAERLISRAESLADAPESGPLLPGRRNTRFLPVRAYLIIFRPDERQRTVRILRFWHSARRTRPTQ
ncbi:MAG: type II toxin-antitoxin system RelE/ParE family toxin [Chthoniobacterales bacterium]|nr:type II toxin-antitoxin system RelE/ParE family toxin [Chthoniobacterales bacterium]